MVRLYLLFKDFGCCLSWHRLSAFAYCRGALEDLPVPGRKDLLLSDEVGEFHGLPVRTLDDARLAAYDLWAEQYSDRFKLLMLGDAKSALFDMDGVQDLPPAATLKQSDLPGLVLTLGTGTKRADFLGSLGVRPYPTPGYMNPERSEQIERFFKNFPEVLIFLLSIRKQPSAAGGEAVLQTMEEDLLTATDQGHQRIKLPRSRQANDLGPSWSRRAGAGFLALWYFLFAFLRPGGA
ncbi:hypothetical protein [Anthocerotibacter panamensis]|uniref:hypothetical protein n=1 Tax=Anthocerotibacter panamensis TaxID=2857077 RepID=UPI001C4057F9|nr:hypothetical protein [Anthocerotibacter panamensis]